ncbi:MAG TPA: hypothetical protein VE196_04195 [Pseudonocardiaceae bacterium]|nr:hypothetical protein [Pseudonocardiaceae bacterium]
MTSRAGVIAGLAVLTLVAAVGVLLAPVTAQDPVVSWPPSWTASRRQRGWQCRYTPMPATNPPRQR